MKRFTVIAWVISLVAVGSYVVLAKPVAYSPAGAHLCPACGVVAGAMTQKALFATEDLGIIVLVGDRLMRFDSHLNKIAETEIQVDVAQMQRRMEQMVQNCSLRPEPALIIVPPETEEEPY